MRGSTRSRASHILRGVFVVWQSTGHFILCRSTDAMHERQTAVQPVFIKDKGHIT